MASVAFRQATPLGDVSPAWQPLLRPGRLSFGNPHAFLPLQRRVVFSAHPARCTDPCACAEPVDLPLLYNDVTLQRHAMEKSAAQSVCSLQWCSSSPTLADVVADNVSTQTPTGSTRTIPSQGTDRGLDDAWFPLGPQRKYEIIALNSGVQSEPIEMLALKSGCLDDLNGSTTASPRKPVARDEEYKSQGENSSCDRSDDISTGDEWSVPLRDMSRPITVLSDAASSSNGTTLSSHRADEDTGCGITKWLFADYHSYDDAEEWDAESEALGGDDGVLPEARYRKEVFPAWCCGGASCCYHVSCACCKKHGRESDSIDDTI